MDVLALARRDHPTAGSWQAAALVVRAAIRDRLRHHVRRGHRPRRALRDRTGGASAQYARPPVYLRAGLCPGLRHERRAMRRAGAAVRRPRRRGGNLDLAHVRDRAVVLDRAPAAWASRTGVREAAFAALILRSGHLAESRRMRFVP